MDYKDWLLPAATKSTFANFSLTSVTCGSLSTNLETEAIVPDAKDGWQASSKLKVVESSVRGPELSPQSFPASLQLISQINVSTLPDINSTVNGKASTPVTYDVQPEYVAGPSEPIKKCRDGRDSYKRKILAIRNLKRHLHSRKLRRIDPTTAGRMNKKKNDATEPRPILVPGNDLGATQDLAQQEVITKPRKRQRIILAEHVKVISDNPTIYKCLICDKSFKTRYHVRYHSFCAGTEKPIKCGHCDKSFVTSGHYKYHLRSHTGERPFVCQTCGTAFKQTGALTRHSKAHCGNQPFSCQICGRKFATSEMLSTHTQSHTGEEKPFPCNVCGKRYRSLSNLKRHVILHTSGKLWQCDICGKRLGSKWSLQLHQKSHSGQRVLCPHCPQTFTSTKDLRRHDLTHTKQRPYQCCLCLARFARKDNLCRHIQTVHNQTRTISWQLALNSAAQNLLSASRQTPTGVVTATETMDNGPCIVDVFTLADVSAAATLAESSST